MLGFMTVYSMSEYKSKNVFLTLLILKNDCALSVWNGKGVGVQICYHLVFCCTHRL